MSLFFLDELTPLTSKVMGEDWTYFSQPRLVHEAPGSPTRFLGTYQLSAMPGFALPPYFACLARCTEVVYIGPSLAVVSALSTGLSPCRGIGWLSSATRNLSPATLVPHRGRYYP